jgi:hypothetical protein
MCNRRLQRKHASLTWFRVEQIADREIVSIHPFTVTGHGCMAPAKLVIMLDPTQIPGAALHFTLCSLPHDHVLIQVGLTGSECWVPRVVSVT